MRSSGPQGAMTSASCRPFHGTNTVWSRGLLPSGSRNLEMGWRMLQSAVSGAIEHQVAENFGAAVRDAEIERFELIELW
jgi:hypothetical protein